jgi:hypothetical protein
VLLKSSTKFMFNFKIKFKILLKILFKIHSAHLGDTAQQGPARSRTVRSPASGHNLDRESSPPVWATAPAHLIAAAIERTERPVRAQPDERRERLGGWQVRRRRRGSPRHRRVRSPLGGHADAERSLGGTLSSWPADLRAMGSTTVASTAATSPRLCA